jgi:hypothetical protein
VNDRVRAERHAAWEILRGEDTCDPDNLQRWPEREWTCNEWSYQPGEGYRYYPGTGGHPWPSVRLENWRDGMEDY